MKGPSDHVEGSAVLDETVEVDHEELELVVGEYEEEVLGPRAAGVAFGIVIAMCVVLVINAPVWRVQVMALAVALLLATVILANFLRRRGAG